MRLLAGIVFHYIFEGAAGPIDTVKAIGAINRGLTFSDGMAVSILALKTIRTVASLQAHPIYTGQSIRALGIILAFDPRCGIRNTNPVVAHFVLTAFRVIATDSHTLAIDTKGLKIAVRAKNALICGLSCRQADTIYTFLRHRAATV